jgi:hypothetical protein
MQENNEYIGIIDRLKRLQGKITGITSVAGAIWTVGIALLFFGVLIAVTFFVWPNTTIRLIIDLILILLLAIFIFFNIIRPYKNKIGFLSIARRLERHYGKFQSRLIGALELYDNAEENRENYSIELIEKTIEDAGGVIGEVNTEVILDKKPIRTASIRTGIIIMVAVLGIIVYPSLIKQSWQLYSNPNTEFSKPPEFSITLSPGESEFYRNTDLEVTATIDGKIPRAVDLYFRFDDGDWAYETINSVDNDSLPVFSYTFKKIKRSMDIYAKSRGIVSEKVRYEVIDPPRLVDIRVKIDNPDYTGLPDIIGDSNDGNISAIKGSRVHIEANANKSLSDSYLLYSDSSRSKLISDDTKIIGDFRVNENSRYTIMLYDIESRVNPDPIWYDIQVLQDYPPAIEIIFPAVDVDLNERMILPIDLAIIDDFGFKNLNLVWWKLSEGQQSEPRKIKLSIPDKNKTEQLINFPWDINPISPLPGDLLYYYCEVSDNDIISGPKWSKTKTFMARLPSLDEILAEVQGSQENQIREVEEVLREQQELREFVKDIAREMLKATEVDWEAQQDAKDILEKQENIAEKLEQLAEEMQENIERLEDNKLIGEEISEKMQELQRLIEEVATPEMKEAMKKLQEALRDMDPNELQKALEEFQMSAEEMLENIERSLELMKQLAIEQKMDLLAEMAQKILEDQQQINENVENASDSSSLADQQQSEQNNESQFNSLKEQFEQLKQMDQQSQHVPEENKSEMESQLNNPEIPQDFNQMQSDMKSGNKNQCKKKGERLEMNLEQLAQLMKAAQEAMQQKMKAAIAQQFQNAIENLIYLSGRQEDVIDSTFEYRGTRESLRSFAADESRLESAVMRTADMLSELSKQTVFLDPTLLRLMGQALESISETTQNLDEKRAEQAIQSGTTAMSNMNMLTMRLMKSKENACQSKSGSGMSEMMEKLGQCAGKQAGLNNQTMMGLPKPGQSLTPGQQQSLQRLAAEQEALRQQLSEIGSQYGEKGNILGRLSDLGEEMKKVAEDLRNNNVNRETIKRQEGILSRLLDTQKSVNRREYSKKRKAETGLDVSRLSPILANDLNADSERIMDIIKRALEEQYPRQYERLIKSYFKSFQNEGGNLDQQ